MQFGVTGTEGVNDSAVLDRWVSAVGVSMVTVIGLLSWSGMHMVLFGGLSSVLSCAPPPSPVSYPISSLLFTSSACWGV